MQRIQILAKMTIRLMGMSFLLMSACCGEKVEVASVISNDKKYCEQKIEPFAHTVCQVKQHTLLEQKDKLAFKLFWRSYNDNTNKNIKPIYTFDNLIKKNLSNNEKLVFAMNAGMYNADFAPIGYTVIDSKQILSLNLNKGAGNFHLMPNGVFWWDNAGFYITESETMSDMIKSGTVPNYASQSGPMLVINGEIHPEFSASSQSKKIRNGVGLCKDGVVASVISDMPVTFYKFAQLFKDTLQCDNALFFDGGIASAMYAPEIDRNSPKDMGVILGLVENK